MGMYTELALNVRLKDDTPDNVGDVLKFMASTKDPLALMEYYSTTIYYAHETEQNVIVDMKLPDCRPFNFEDSRWVWMLRSDSRHDPYIHWLKDYKFITCYFNLKNYKSEIDDFITWIAPYIHEGYSEGDVIGFCQYEEYYFPSLVKIIYEEVHNYESPYIPSKRLTVDLKYGEGKAW